MLFPFLLLLGGEHGIYRAWGLQVPDFPSGIPWQTSLSAYYHAGFKCIAHMGALRDIFVGSLWTISFSLVMYTGFSKLENWLLNFAGAALLGVAFFPTDWPASTATESCQGSQPYSWRPFGLPQWLSLHTIFAIVFYVLIFLVTNHTSMNTVNNLPNGPKKRKWQRVYEGNSIRIGTVNVFMPGAKWVMIYALVPAVVSFIVDRQRIVLWLEIIGIVTFGIYWLLKSFEMIDTRLDIALIESGLGLSSIAKEYKWGEEGRSSLVKT